MSNVLPTHEQKRVWKFYRTRFIFLGSVTLGIIAIIALAALSPSYIMLYLNRPITDDVGKNSLQKSAAQDHAEASKAQVLVTQLLPFVGATTSVMDTLSQALDGKPAGIVIGQITYSSDANGGTITLRGNSKTREQIDTFRKELTAKGIYKSVIIPVGDLVGASGNQFTVTLITKK